MAIPIWQDYYLQYQAIKVEFSISHGNAVIYEGVAFKRPNAETIDIKINDICANYLRNSLPSIFPNAGAEIITTEYNFVINAQLTEEDSASTEISDVTFLYDWSFDYNRANNGNKSLSAPILRKIPYNAPLLYTATKEGGNYIAIQTNNASFGSSFDSSFDTNTIETEMQTGVENANNIFALSEKDKSVTIYDKNAEAIKYEIVGGCYRYMLYYLNAFGGWDFLLIEGKDKQTDNYTRSTIGQTYNNAQSRNRGTRNYRNDIARKWDLHTLWIDDAGAQNMYHLLGSVDVYLFDLQEQQLYPVTIDNSNCEYKTYSNSGNQLVRYDITATLAKTLTRR